MLSLDVIQNLDLIYWAPQVSLWSRVNPIYLTTIMRLEFKYNNRMTRNRMIQRISEGNIVCIDLD